MAEFVLQFVIRKVYTVYDIWMGWWKKDVNLKKHGISFDDAILVFDDPYVLILRDDIHSNSEERFIAIGMANDVLFVVYTERANNIRIISARKAVKAEIKEYYDRVL